MIPDTATILLINICIGVALLFILIHAWRTRTTYHGFVVWIAGTACWTVGSAFSMLLPTLLPLLISKIIGNGLMLVHPLLLCEGIKQFYGIRRSWWGTAFNLALMLASLIGLAYFLYSVDSLAARTIIVNSVLAFFFVRVALEPLFVAEARKSSMQWLLSVTLLPLIALLLLRVWYYYGSVSAPTGAQTMMPHDAILRWLLFYGIWVEVIIAYSYLSLNSDRVEWKLRQGEEKYRILFRDSPDAYLIIAEGVFIDCNHAAEVMLRCDRAQIIGKPPELLSPGFQPDGKQSSESAKEKIQHALQRGNHSFEWVHRRLDNSDFFVEVSIAPMLLDGKEVLFTTWRNITDRKLAESLLERSEIKYRTLYDSTSDAVMLLDDHGFFDCNNATLEVFGFATRDAFCSSHPGELSPPQQPCGTDSLDLSNQHIAAALEKGSHHFEWVHRRADNELNFPAEVLLSSMELDGKKVLQATVRDITRRKHAEKVLEEYRCKLEALSNTDGLTGIANRRRFDEVLAKELARHFRSKAALSLILLDIDYFKAFNDIYGHVKGDECLRQVGRVIGVCTNRAADLAARFGGEEFACILPETNQSGAIAIAEQIRQGIQALDIPHKGSNVAKCVTASLGVVTMKCTADSSVEDILTQADTLLYQAKSSGRNRVKFGSAPDF